MKEIVVVGLGPGSKELLSYQAYKILLSGEKIFLRTNQHPVVQELTQMGIEFESFDDVYEKEKTFFQVYEKIVLRLIESLSETFGEKIIYGVPGHPLVAEETVSRLLKEAETQNIKVTIIPSMSFMDSLYTILKMDVTEGVLLLDALSLKVDDINPRCHLIITQMYNKMVAADLKLTLLDVYPPEHPVIIIQAAGIAGIEREVRIELHELDHQTFIDHLTAVYVQPCKDIIHKQKTTYPLDPLVEVMEALLSPEGCPWDREQNHISLKPYLIEEAYEVIEAIDKRDMNKLQEELGDLLLQVVFHTALAQKRDDFTHNDVIEGIVKKMIRRHPHVFADISVKNSDEVLVNWDIIKAQEKEGNNLKNKRIMEEINKSLPALLLAEEVQKKARKVGFDWKDISGPWEKVKEEIDELEIACKENENIADELGDLLFAIVNLSRFLKLSPEAALYGTIQKFIRRFNFIEEKLLKNNQKWKDMDMEELDLLWEEAKGEGIN